MSQIPFIDIAVQDAVREAMLDGQAAVIFDRNIETVIWANGNASNMFGYEAIGDFLSAGLTPFSTTLRQLKTAAERRPIFAQDMLLRVTAGMRSQLAKAQIQIISLAALEDDVVLLVFERADDADSDHEPAQDTIMALEADGAGAAILGDDGSIIVQGPLFESIGLPAAELAQLVEEVRAEDDRLVKRLVSRGANLTKIAAGIGRLSEEPARCLVVAFETDIQTDATEAPTTQDATPKNETIDHAPPLVDRYDDDDTDLSFEPSLSSDDDEPQSLTSTPESDPETAVPAFEADLASGPVRFVWKTDAYETFIDVSPEFAKAVGNNAADIIDRKMEDVVRVFGLGEDGDILASMKRRDTWSGKSVLWPVQGTDLRVPVDLAALPYYTRNRDFEGYRGFGIVRMADAVLDPEALGLSLESDPISANSDDMKTEVESAIPTENDEFSDEDPIGDHRDDDTSIDEELNSDDPFEGEIPALSTSNITPLRRRDDFENIVPFGTRQTPPLVPESGLDENEADAFKRIGEALSKNVSDQTDDTPDQDIDEASTSHQTPDNDDFNDDIVSVDDEEIKTPPTTEPPLPLLNRLPESALSDVPDAKPEPHNLRNDDELQTPGLGPEELNALPLPLLIVRDEDALFGNHAFCELTGYDDIAMLNARGVSSLFGEDPNTPDDNRRNQPLSLVSRNGHDIPVRAHLQIVPWLSASAMMFAFEPQVEQESSPSLAPDDLIEQSNQLSSVSDSLRSAAFDEVSEMRAILDIATDGVVVIAPDGMIRSLNGPASALFEYSSDELEGKSFSILFANESQRAAMDYFDGFSNNSVASLLNEGREVLAREKNGGFLPVFMTIGRLPTSGGFCAVMRDITPWKETEHALEDAKQLAEEASRTKSEFLAKISHEIRTPLNAIIGFSDLMTEERFGPIGNERYKSYLADINKSGRHVLELVNDLLDISKIEAGEQELAFESVLLNEAIADAISMMQPQANRNRIIVRSSLESDLPPVVADARSVKQIVINLLSNAIRFTQSGGQVVVSTNYTPRGAIVFKVRDTGIGMSEREIELALRPFQQVGTTAASDGTGLGLPLTKALVEANRAEFQITSQPRRGTSVEVTFPPARVLAD